MPESAALVPVESHPTVLALGALTATTPAGVLEAAAAIATPLKAMIDRQHLAVTISGRQYVKCDGWTAMMAMLGITPHEISVTEDEGVFTAVVELRRIVDGQPIARASAECGADDEPTWAKRARYARRSMALTRATAKAARLAFSWIVIMAGYEATPLEEMPPQEPEAPAPAAPTKAARISKQERAQLFYAAEAAGWPAEDMRAVLADRFHVTSTEQITKAAYPEIMRYFSGAPGPGLGPDA